MPLKKKLTAHQEHVFHELFNPRNYFMGGACFITYEILRGNILEAHMRMLGLSDRQRTQIAEESAFNTLHVLRNGCFPSGEVPSYSKQGRCLLRVTDADDAFWEFLEEAIFESMVLGYVPEKVIENIKYFIMFTTCANPSIQLWDRYNLFKQKSLAALDLTLRYAATTAWQELDVWAWRKQQKLFPANRIRCWFPSLAVNFTTMAAWYLDYMSPELAAAVVGVSTIGGIIFNQCNHNININFDLLVKYRQRYQQIKIITPVYMKIPASTQVFTTFSCFPEEAGRILREEYQQDPINAVSLPIQSVVNYPDGLTKSQYDQHRAISRKMAEPVTIWPGYPSPGTPFTPSIEGLPHHYAFLNLRCLDSTGFNDGHQYFRKFCDLCKYPVLVPSWGSTGIKRLRRHPKYDYEIKIKNIPDRIFGKVVVGCAGWEHLKLVDFCYYSPQGLH